MQFPIPLLRVAIINIFSDWVVWWEWLNLSGWQSRSGNELLRFPDVRKSLRKTRRLIPENEIKHLLIPNACALCFCLGYSGPFVWDTSPKSIDREGLGESRTGTRQVVSYWEWLKDDKALSCCLALPLLSCFESVSQITWRKATF